MPICQTVVDICRIGHVRFALQPKGLVKQNIYNSNNVLPITTPSSGIFCEKLLMYLAMENPNPLSRLVLAHIWACGDVAMALPPPYTVVLSLVTDPRFNTFSGQISTVRDFALTARRTSCLLRH